ncbi:glycosyl hydrolase 53 family protein [uncultured Gilvimarinus sp.]|uniref:glycosyl hydrolase 53 family protein n=1 Tax=uncultured Gilvimarinus sp. TaxID=1689143 RepID=UPI0030DC72FD
MIDFISGKTLAARSIAAKVLVLLALTLLSGHSLAQNLLSNSGFENGTNGWTLGGDASAQLVESSGRNGNRLTHWSSSASYSANTSQTVTGLQNGTYRLTAYTVGGDSSQARLYATNCGGSDKQSPIVASAWGSWTPVTVDNINVTGGSCTVGIYTENSEWTSIDDVSFELVSASSSGSAIEVLAGHGFNYARIRLLVNPPGEYALHQDLDYVIATAQEAKAQGMNILLDIFYSDWWADPAQNWAPTAWNNMNINTLQSTVYDYTRDVLLQMQNAGVLPNMVQVGNEVNPGMCWELGRLATNGWGNFVSLTNSGYDAVKSVGNIPVIIHYAGVGSEATAWYSSYVNNGGKMDAQGLSFYEMWHGNISDAVWTINTLYNTYGQDVFLVETAAYWTASDAGSSTSYPHTKQGQYDYLYDLTHSVKNLNGFAGLFYWGATWTQSSLWLNAPAWSDDDAATRSLFDNNAQLTPAADAITGAGGLSIMGVDVSEAHNAEANGVVYQD